MSEKRILVVDDEYLIRWTLQKNLEKEGYGVSLAESINTVKLRYTLGDRWTIKTEAGENRSADLVYTIER